MIVVIIIAISAAVLVPNLGAPSGAVGLEVAARRVADLLDYAYNAAVSTRRVHAVVFSGDGAEVVLLAEAAPSPEDGAETDASGLPASPTAADEFGEPSLEPVGFPPSLARGLPPGIRLTNANAFEEDLLAGEEETTRILFFPDGTTEFVNLELSDEREQRIMVKLNGLSGAVRIGPPTAEDEEAREGN